MSIQFQKKVQLQVPASVAMLYSLCLVIPMVLRLIGPVLHGCYLLLDNGGNGGLSVAAGSVVAAATGRAVGGRRRRRGASGVGGFF